MRRAIACLFVPLLASALLADPWKQPGEIRQPKGPWQTPGEIRQPKGHWQIPSDLQVPKEVKVVKEKNRVRLRINADTLFAYDKATLSPAAEGVLQKLGPELKKFGSGSLTTIEGHTDSKGSDDYNQRLSEARARTVRDWLQAHSYVPGTAVTAGYGEKRPVAANARPDGSDNPEGRRLNRRVEIVVEESR